jgi:hypothetical protein
MICNACKCSIFIGDPVKDSAPGIEYKTQLYCNKCIEGIYFMEDIEREDDINEEPVKSSKLTKPVKPDNILHCPFCKISINTDKKCPQCQKIHPLYIRKTKKKRRKR